MIWLLALTLFEQSTVQLLQSRFADPDLSYLVTDARTGKVLAQRWNSADLPIAVGSLIKPFLMDQIPSSTRHRCDGTLCWDARGHGELGMKEALAYSCNSYFLAANVPAARLMGLEDKWKVSPLGLAEAYRLLLSRSDAATVRQGLRMAASVGTGKLARVGAWVKTGTARCSHSRKAPGDGFTVIADERYILVTRQHGTTGAATAKTAGDIWRAMLYGR